MELGRDSDTGGQVLVNLTQTNDRENPFIPSI